MKQLLFSVLLVAGFCIGGNAQDFNKPTDYMDYLQQQQDNITKRYLAYTSASAHGKREKKVESLRNKLINEIQESRMNISGMPG